MGSDLQSTTNYVDGFVYIAAGTGASALSYFPMPEGRVLYNSGTFTQEFIITDQQGNARVSFQNNAGTAKVYQENSYYGYGMAFLTSPVSLPTTPNKQLYNGGSEWQNDFSNLPDYYQTFYRNYDAALGRFVGVDPMAEASESLSSYNYAGNNPVVYNDPNGDYAINPFTPGFNTQVGNWITDPEVHNGFTPEGNTSNAGFGPCNCGGNSSGVYDIGESSMDNANLYPLYNAANKARISGDPLDYEQYGFENASQVLYNGPPVSFSFTQSANGIRYGYYSYSIFENVGGQVKYHSGVIGGGANQEGGPLTHAQELAKYGQVIGGTSLSISVGALRQGFVIEYGSVYTDKNYQIDYKTVYKLSTTATISYSPGGFSVYSKSGYNTTFSDWAGPVTGYSISFLAFTYTREWSTTYNTYGLGVGPSISLPKIGTGAYVTGTTTLIGQPYLAPPVSGD
ncbi:MAG: hypothetical protein JWR09_3213 [Mucilaginibacter sp.]|nr:hypothetical protein [Mucilaginibacter sp.]